MAGSRQVSVVIVICCIFALAKALTMDKSKAVPSKRKYVAAGYAINAVPNDLNYNNPACGLIGSAVNAMLDDYHLSSEGSDFNPGKAMQKWHSCSSTICNSNKIMQKLQKRGELMEELGSVVISFGKTFKPAHSVFWMLVDPVFIKSISGLKGAEFPIVSRVVFPKQQHAAYKIIMKACGYQKQTIKEQLSPPIVTELFATILVESYTQNSFSGGTFEKIIGSINDLDVLTGYWNSAADKRTKTHDCLDPNLEYKDQHTTIENVQKLARTLTGVSCTEQDDGFDYVSAGFEAVGPPSAPGTGNTGPPSEAIQSGGAPSGWPSSSFTP